MSALAQELSSDAVVEQRVGSVLGRDRDAYRVRIGAELRVARRAATCLLEPRECDTVLVVTTEAGQAWVLAVLEQAAEGATLSFETDVTLKSKGRVTIASSRGTELYSRGDVSVAADRVRVNATEGEIFLTRAALFAARAFVKVETIKTVADVVDRVATRISERAKRVYRRVEEADYLRSGEIDYASENAITMQAKTTVLTSQDLMKLNGDQIHLG